MLRATAAPFVPYGAVLLAEPEHTVFTIQLGTSCGTSMVASDYSAPSSPRSSVAGSLADDRDLETHVAPRNPVCPQLRKIGKKLAQIEQLKAKQAAGTKLDANQLAKVTQETELRAQKSILERDLASKRAQALEVLSHATPTAATTTARGNSRRHGRRSTVRPTARSANGHPKPLAHVSLHMYIDRAEAAPPKGDALSQLDQKVKAVRAAEARRQGWFRVSTRK